MKAIILYATKSGAAGECADILAEKLGCPACDLSEKTPDISLYDTFIIGSGVRMGRIYRPALQFIRQHVDAISQKRVAVFFCNALPETFDEAVERNLPSKLAQDAICIESFGGKQPFTKQETKDWLNEGNLNKFIAAIQPALLEGASDE